MPQTPPNAMPSEAGTPEPPDSQRETIRLDPATHPTIDPTHPTISADAARAPQAAPCPEGRPFGRYRLLAELGRGGMGVVWKAWDTDLKRIVALKQILAEAYIDVARVERFMQEARLAAKLRHPGIVAVFDVGVHEGQHYYTSEFVDGGSIDRRLKAAGADGLPPRQSIAWVREVAEALAAAHAAGVLHRDVKPSNVLVDAAGRAHVADFGLAREADLATHAALTASGEVVGTPSYMSPEQTLADPGRIGPASDQFSLGVVLYELLAGHMPFEGASLRDLFNAIVEADPIPPSQRNRRVHRDAETICLKALEKDPARRYADMAALASDLGRWLDGEPIEARPLSAASRLMRRLAKHRVVVIPSTVAVLLGSALVLSLLVSHAREADRERQRTRDAAERDAIARKAAAAQALLRKAAIVSSVLGRWAQVQEALERMERWATASSLPSRERRTRLAAEWPAIQRFVEETPADATSQATMKALAGWARVLAGRSDEGMEWMEQATRADPDVPYGALLRALAYSAQLVEGRLLPPVLTGVTGFHVGPASGESAAEKAGRAMVERLLAEAEQAPIWGQEGAGACLSALAGVRAMQTGDYAAAEAAFSRAIPAVELRAARGILLLARGKSRYLRGDFAGAREDMEAVIARRPDSARAYAYRGLVEHALGAETAVDGRDPTPALERAIATFSEANERDPDLVDAFVGRGNARVALASFCQRRGGDPQSLLEAAILDYTEAARRNPSDPVIALDRANARCALAVAIQMRGGDPDGELLRAISDADAAIAIAPEEASAYANRGLARIRLGEALSIRGEESLPHFEHAVADLDAAIRIAPEAANSWYDRGMAHRFRGDALAQQGKDPTGDYDQALADFAQALEIEGAFADAHHGVGMVWLSRGEWEEVRGETPAASLDRAIEAFARAIEATPFHGVSSMARGLARARLAEAAPPGRDQRALLRESIEDFTAAIARDSDTATARLNRAYAYGLLAGVEEEANEDPCPEYERAIADLDEAVRSNPGSPLALCNRGMTKLFLGEAREQRGVDSSACAEGALADLQEAIRRFPRFWTAQSNLGRVFESIGCPVEAVAAYEKAISLRGGADARLQASLDRARAAAERFESDKPGWARTADRAFARVTLGDYEAARPLFEQAMRDAGEGAPDSQSLRIVLVNVRYNLACIYALASVGRAAPGSEPRPIDPAEAARLRDEAFSQLAAAADLGWKDRKHVAEDADLLPLHDDARWGPFLERLGH